MVKRKAPVVLALLEESTQYGNGSPMMQPQVQDTQVRSKVSLRVCTPSPPASPSPFRDVWRKHFLTQQRFSSSKPQYPAPGGISTEQKPVFAMKRRLSGSWQPSSIELVDPELDIAFASKYDMLLFSHMVMKSTTESPSFGCRLCVVSDDFACLSAASASNHVPSIENHLLLCSGSPAWLKQQIWKNNGKVETRPNDEYSELLWKRMTAHRIHELLHRRKVHFAKSHKEIIIPSCNTGRCCRRKYRCE
jgi:hypothetical protein